MRRPGRAAVRRPSLSIVRAAVRRTCWLLCAKAVLQSFSWRRCRHGAGRADPKEDGVYKVASKFGARGLTRGELGLLLKQGPLRPELRIGRVASLNRHIHVGFGDVSSAPRDLLSMPVCKPDPDETRILKAMAAGATPRDLRKGFPRSVPRAARAAWVSSSSCWSTSCTSAGASRARS